MQSHDIASTWHWITKYLLFESVREAGLVVSKLYRIRMLYQSGSIFLLNPS